MTDNEIIKILIDYGTQCKPYVISEAIDLITRQQEEIEKLKKLKCFEIFIDGRIHKSNELGLRREFRTKDDYDEAFKKEIDKLYDISTATVEAIKEFADLMLELYEGDIVGEMDCHVRIIRQNIKDIRDKLIEELTERKDDEGK